MYKHGKIIKPTGGELHLLHCGEEDNPCVRITIIHPPDPNNPDITGPCTLAITVKRGDLTDILTDMEL